LLDGQSWQVEPRTFECWKVPLTTTPDNQYDNIMIIIFMIMTVNIKTIFHININNVDNNIVILKILLM